MTIETARTLAARHGGQIQREIMWLVKKVEAQTAALIRYTNGDSCEYGDGPPCPGDEGATECCYCQAMGVLGGDTHENAHQTAPAPNSGTEAPVLETRGGPPPDDALTGFLDQQPRSLAAICKRFNVPYAPPPYPPGVKAIRNQLQRLRGDKLIRCSGGRWGIW